MPDDRKRRWNANDIGNQMMMQLINAGNRFTSKGNDNITLAQSGTIRRTVRLGTRHQHAMFGRQMVETRDAPMDGRILAHDTNPTAANPAFFDQPGGDKFRSVA